MPPSNSNASVAKPARSTQDRATSLVLVTRVSTSAVTSSSCAMTKSRKAGKGSPRPRRQRLKRGIIIHRQRQLLIKRRAEIQRLAGEAAPIVFFRGNHGFFADSRFLKHSVNCAGQGQT